MKRRTVIKIRKITSMTVMISIIAFTGYFAALYVNSKQFNTYRINSLTREEGGREETNNMEETIKIASLGNIIFHEKQLQGGKRENGYDFRESFKYIKPILEDIDLGVAVLETTLQGNGNYSGFPLFNSPDEVLDALKDSGVNMINLGNNHIWDGGIEAFKRTVQTTKKYGLGVLGARESVNESEYEIAEIKGKKIGMLSYVFETEIVDGQSTINSIKISESEKVLLNTFNYGKLDELYKDIEENMNFMKGEGVEFVIVAIHWGDEYDNEPNSYQLEIANKLSEMGVDIVLGNHSHVIQPYEIITNSQGKETFVIYGQGNNLSNQCFDEIGDPRTEDGYIVSFELVANKNNLRIKNYEIIPLWLYREPRSDGLYTHRMIPLKYIDRYGITVPASSSESSATSSLRRTEEILGKNKIGIFEF